MSMGSYDTVPFEARLPLRRKRSVRLLRRSSVGVVYVRGCLLPYFVQRRHVFVVTLNPDQVLHVVEALGLKDLDDLRNVLLVRPDKHEPCRHQSARQREFLQMAAVVVGRRVDENRLQSDRSTSLTLKIFPKDV